VTEPIRARTNAVSKALAAELALKALEDKSSNYHLSRLCDCSATGGEVKPTVDIGEEEEEEEEGEGGGGGEGEGEGEGEGPVEDPVQKDETEEGFAMLAQRLVNAREGRSPGAGADNGESSDMDISEDEAEVH